MDSKQIDKILQGRLENTKRAISRLKGETQKFGYKENMKELE